MSKAFVALTEAGLQAIEGAAPAHRASLRRYLVDALTAEQLDAFAEVSETVLGRLATHDGEEQDCPQS